MEKQIRHVTDGELLAYSDHQLSADERATVTAHLRDCHQCQVQYQQLKDGVQRVDALLGTLEPGPFEQTDTQRALAGLRQSVRETEQRSDWLPMLENWFKNKNVRYALTAVVVIGVLVAAFSFAPVQAFASNVLSWFRVEQFTVVEIDPERLQEIAENVPEDAYFGEHEVLAEGTQEAVATIGEAEALAGFSLLVPDGFGDPASIMVSGGQEMRFTPDVAGIREVFEAVGLDPELMPESVDGQPFDVSVPLGVMLAYGDAETAQGFVVHQGPAPAVNVPDDVDMQALGEAMLVLLGVDPADAAHLAESIDWTTTLVLPIPQGLVNVQEVDVQGTTGLLFTDFNGDPDMPAGTSLLWQKDGFVYFVAATDAAADVLDIAESLK